MRKSIKIKKVFIYASLMALLFLGALGGCEIQRSDTATLVFSSQLFDSGEIKRKIVKRDDEINITSVELEIRNDEINFLIQETIEQGSGELRFTVPVGVVLTLKSKAYQEEVLQYQGETRVGPLVTGQSKTISFYMYSVEENPLLVDIGLSNKIANGSSVGSRFSLSKNYVLFTSAASNLTEGDTNEGIDLFLRDLDSNNIINLHSDSQGIPVDVADALVVTDVDISADGRFVAFTSKADSLVPGDTNGVSDIFLKDTLSGEVKRISVTTDGAQVQKASYQPDISNDGRYIIFFSEADLTGNGAGRLFLYDRIAKTIKSSVQNARQARLSGDGNYLVYIDSQIGDLILYSNLDGSRISIAGASDASASQKSVLAAKQKTGLSSSNGFEYAISRNGNYVAFSLQKSTEQYNSGEVYLFEREQRQVRRISERQDATPIPSYSIALRYPGLSDDGRYAVFRLDNTVYIKVMQSGELVAVADGSNPFISPSGERIGVSNIDGRLFMHQNRLYKAQVGTSSITTNLPTDLSLNFIDGKNNLKVTWQANESSAYYRVYVANESGVTPENYLEKDGGMLYETVENSLVIPIGANKQDAFYLVVSAIDVKGEGGASEEAHLSLNYQIALQTSSGGSVEPFGVQTVTDNEIVEFTLVPNLGYTIGTVSGCGGSLADNVYTTGAIVQDCEVVINFELISHTFSYSAEQNGVVKGDTAQVVNYGANGTEVVAVPDSGYYFVEWSDGSKDNPRIDTSVTSNGNVIASFAVIEYTLTYSAGANGTISNDSLQYVSSGGEGTPVKAVPNTGYHFVNWSDGTTQNPRTDANVMNNVNVTANFAIDTFSLSYVADVNGSLNGDTNQTADYGSHGSAVAANPNAGYHFVDWSDGSTNNPRTDSNVTSNVLVTANFAINTYSLTYGANSGGTLSGDASQTVNYGFAGSAVTAVPNTGYHFVGWSDGSIQNPRTDTNVTSNLLVTANFAINTYSLTYGANSGGTLSGDTSQTVNYGFAGSDVTAVPNSGYHFVSWSDGSTNNPRMDNNVTNNISVMASFATNVNNAPQFITATGGDQTGPLSLETAQGATVSTNLDLYAQDADEDDISWTISTTPTKGVADFTMIGTGTSKTLGYTPNSGATGSDSLVVTISDGAANDTLQINITILANNAPVVNIETPAQATTILLGESVNFTATASDLEDDALSIPLTYDWSFVGNTGYSSSSSVLSPGQLIFPTTGNFSGSLTATDRFGVSTTRYSPVTYVRNPPIRDISHQFATQLLPRVYSYYEQIVGIKVTSDNKLVVATIASCDTCFSSYLYFRRLDINGNPDTTFGTDGVLQARVNTEFETTYYRQMQLDSNDNILFLMNYSSSYTGPTRAEVWRFTPSGTRDTSFGIGGAAYLPSGEYYARSMIIDNSDQLYATGRETVDALDETGAVVGTNTNLAVWKINATNGAVVNSFATNGVYKYDGTEQANSWDEGANLLLTPQGLLVSGSTVGPNDNSNDLLLIRMNTSGVLDNTFGSGGIATANSRFIHNSTLMSGNDANAYLGNGMAVDSNNRILIASTANIVNANPIESKVILWCFTPSGVPDTSFGIRGDGTFIYDDYIYDPEIGFGSFQRGYGTYVKVNSNDEIIMSGSVAITSRSYIGMWFFDSNGNPLVQYGKGGVWLTDANGADDIYSVYFTDISANRSVIYGLNRGYNYAGYTLPIRY